MNHKLTNEIEPMRMSTKTFEDNTLDNDVLKINKSIDSKKKVHMKIYKL